MGTSKLSFLITLSEWITTESSGSFFNIVLKSSVTRQTVNSSCLNKRYTECPLNPTETMLMRNRRVSVVPFSLIGRIISDCSSSVHLGHEVNVANRSSAEAERAASGAFKNVEEVVRKTKNVRIRAHLSGSTVLRVLSYA